MSIDTGVLGAAEHQLGGAPADVDGQRGRGPAAGRAVVVASKTRAASSIPESTTGVTPRRARTPSTNTSRVRGVARRRRRAEADPLDRHAVRADGRREVLDRGERAGQRLVGQTAGLVDALPEPDDARLAARSTCGQVGDQQLDGVGAAVDRGDPAHAGSASGATHGPSDHHSPSLASDLVTEQVDARPGGQRVGGQDVQALHPASASRRRRPPRARGRRRAPLGRPGRPRGRRRRTRPARGRRRAGPPSPSSARSSRACRSARRRADRSGSTSSGTACRRAAAARSRRRRAASRGSGGRRRGCRASGRPSWRLHRGQVGVGDGTRPVRPVTRGSPAVAAAEVLQRLLLGLRRRRVAGQLHRLPLGGPPGGGRRRVVDVRGSLSVACAASGLPSAPITT